MRGNTASGKCSHQANCKNGGKVMTNHGKKVAIAILIGLVTVLALVSTSAASAVWGG